MKTVIYGRISTGEQNDARQRQKANKEQTPCFIDVCSGAVPFMERPKAKQLIAYLIKNHDAQVNILSVDRLGRNTLDILNTLEFFNSMGFNIRIENLGMDSDSPFFSMMVSIMGTLAEQERKTIRERCQQGIQIAKAEGKYTGRKNGTTDDRAKILAKHSDIVECLRANMKVSKIAEVTGKTRVTVYRVKDVL